MATNATVNRTELETKVQDMYRQVALNPQGEFHFEMGRALAERLGYSPADLDRIPRESIDSFAGVGYYFDLADLKMQLEQVQKMGGIASLMDKLPSAAMKGGAPNADQGDKDVRRQIAIINSMTRKERRHPAILDGSRRRRIAAGAGVQVQDVNRLMKQFMEMQKMMKSFGGGKLKRMMSAFKGQMPPGFPGGK